MKNQNKKVNELFLRGLLRYVIKNLKFFYGRRAWSTTMKLTFFNPNFITLYYHDFYKNRN
jgi:hypothetical protein